MSIICCDGVDGVGKSAVCKLLVEQLCDQGYNALYCREPGGTKLGEALRPLLLDKELAMDAQAQTLLFTASRIQLLTESLPALDAGAILVFDRFWHSTVAYQHYGKGVPKHFIEALNQQCHAALHRGCDLPDEPSRQVVAFHLYCTAQEAKRRLAQTGKAPDRFEGKDRDFQERVARAYVDLEDSFVATQFGVDSLAPVGTDKPVVRVVRDILMYLGERLAKHPKKGTNAV
jgi:dTMP kinase